MDKNGDFIGEVPGPDKDGDGASDSDDNCPNLWNPDQRDSDGDGIGDVCDNSVFVKNHAESTRALISSRISRTSRTRTSPRSWRSTGGAQPQPPIRPQEGFIEKNWPGDACDPTPLTVTDSAGGNFAPAGRLSS